MSDEVGSGTLYFKSILTKGLPLSKIESRQIKCIKLKLEGQIYDIDQSRETKKVFKPSLNGIKNKILGKIRNYHLIYKKNLKKFPNRGQLKGFFEKIFLKKKSKQDFI